MAYGVKLKVWGLYACFSRPEMKVERVSYDVITPSAARNILQAIYWKPGIQWIIDRIHVMNPILFINIRRNELEHKISAINVKKAMKDGAFPIYTFIEEERQQRAGLILRDVAYVIETHFELEDPNDINTAKHLEMFKRRARKGQCFTQPYLGTREFSAYFELVEKDVPKSALRGERDLGYMLHDIDFKNNMEAHFFRACMKNGIIEVPPFRSEGVVS